MDQEVRSDKQLYRWEFFFEECDPAGAVSLVFEEVDIYNARDVGDILSIVRTSIQRRFTTPLRNWWVDGDGHIWGWADAHAVCVGKYFGTPTARTFNGGMA